MALASPPTSTPIPHPARLNTLNAYLYHHGYRMGKLIGEGSYSKVRLCPRRSDTEDGQGHEKDPAVACKVINKRKASSDFVNKFLPRELQIVSKIKHFNIVRVYDVVEFDYYVYIFMDYCNNGDLLEYVKQRGFIKETRSQLYFRQVLSAVKYLHGLDIAHRDLKCENVLLTAEDQVRLSDFGFARTCRDSQSGKRILSNTYCGSCAYAAPEILQGTAYNPKLYDMWSLGCILFIILTGHMPFDESNVPKMLQNQMERNLNYPHQMEGVISKSAKRLIRFHANIQNELYKIVRTVRILVSLGSRTGVLKYQRGIFPFFKFFYLFCTPITMLIAIKLYMLLSNLTKSKPHVIR